MIYCINPIDPWECLVRLIIILYCRNRVTSKTEFQKVISCCFLSLVVVFVTGDPSSDESLYGDPFKTLFCTRIVSTSRIIAALERLQISRIIPA